MNEEEEEKPKCDECGKELKEDEHDLCQGCYLICECW